MRIHVYCTSAPHNNKVISFMVEGRKNVKDFIHSVFSGSFFSPARLFLPLSHRGTWEAEVHKTSWIRRMTGTDRKVFATDGGGRMCLPATPSPHIKTNPDLQLRQQANKGPFQGKHKGRDGAEWDWLLSLKIMQVPRLANLDRFEKITKIPDRVTG